MERQIEPCSFPLTRQKRVVYSNKLITSSNILGFSSCKFIYVDYPFKTIIINKCGLVAQLCLTLYDPMDYSVHGIFQARILEGLSFSSPGNLLDPGIKPGSPALQAHSLPLNHLGIYYQHSCMNMSKVFRCNLFCCSWLLKTCYRQVLVNIYHLLIYNYTCDIKISL